MDFDDMNFKQAFYSLQMKRHIRSPGKAEIRQLLELNVKARLTKRGPMATKQYRDKACMTRFDRSKAGQTQAHQLPNMLSINILLLLLNAPFANRRGFFRQ
jgi:hypothetical protein